MLNYYNKADTKGKLSKLCSIKTIGGRVLPQGRLAAADLEVAVIADLEATGVGAHPLLVSVRADQGETMETEALHRLVVEAEAEDLRVSISTYLNL